MKLSWRVKRRLDRLGITTTTEERQEIDRIIKKRTGKDCDEAEPLIRSDKEFRRIVEEAKRRVRERKKEPIPYV